MYLLLQTVPIGLCCKVSLNYICFFIYLFTKIRKLQIDFGIDENTVINAYAKEGCGCCKYFKIRFCIESIVWILYTILTLPTRRYCYLQQKVCTWETTSVTYCVSSLHIVV